MARIFERPKQTVKGHYSDGGSTREYGIVEAPTRDIALTYVQNVIPAFDYVGGTTGVQFFFQHIDLREAGGGCWDAIVHYGKSPNTTEMVFDIGNTHFKATTSKVTMASYGCEENVGDPEFGPVIGVDYPNFKKGIGWDGKKFDGVDLEAPHLDITYSKKFAATTLVASYLVTLFDLAQTVNDKDYSITWEGQELQFKKGTLRFRGARIKRDSDGGIDFTYHFVYARSIREADNFTIGSSGPIEKEGHQFMWVLFVDSTSGGQQIKIPKAVYIEKVYDYGDFTAIQL